jgi:hypothetical protein
MIKKCTDFSVVSAPDTQFIGTIEIEVGFTPLQIGSCSNTLTVEGTVDGINIIPTSINLTGTGVEAISDQPEPLNKSRPSPSYCALFLYRSCDEFTNQKITGWQGIHEVSWWKATNS